MAQVPLDVVRQGMRVLARGAREEPRVFGVAVACAALWGVATVAAAFVLGRVVDAVVVPALESGDVSEASLALGVAAVLGVALARAVGVAGRRIGAGVVQYRLQASYRRRVTRQYLRLPLSWHARHPTGQLLSNANADVEAVWAPMAPFPMAVGVVVMLVVATAGMLVTDVVLALVAVAVFPTLAAVNVAYNRRLAPLATRAQQMRADVSGTAHESFDGALVVKTLGREAEETARFRASAEELRDSLRAVGRVRGMFDPVLEALPNLGVLAVLLVGTWRLESGDIGVEGLVRVAYLFTLLAFPLRALGWVLAELPRSVVGYARVDAVLQATGELPHGSVDLPRSTDPARLSAAGLGFAYEGTDGGPGRSVLTDVHLDVAPGRTVAVVGPTGAGKSTLVTLLVRLVDPTAGAVLLDGVDVRGLRAGAVPTAVAFVPQTAFLFDDSVRDNVALGADVPDEEVWTALRLARADGFVAALPSGLDTLVGERGTTLSGGQRQRIALARALVRRPRLLVLDDATSAVDPHVEREVLEGLREAALPSTVVVVAYRRSTIALADEVVWVQEGRVTARGTHEELLASVPGYRDLVTAYEQHEVRP